MRTRKLRSLLLCSAALSAGWGAAAQQAVDLGTIEVRSKREVQTDTARAETVVDAEEIEDRQPSTIAELVDSAPGVNLINGNSPSGSGINIRGFGAGSTYGTDQKVGIQFGGASKGSEELYRIGTQLFTDPALFREAVVTRGMGGTFEYGSGFFGGLVRLEPIQAGDLTGGVDGFRLRQTLQFSTNGNGVTASTIGGWQRGNLEILGNYTIRREGVQTDGAGNPRSEQGYELPSWLINSRYTFGGQREHALSFMVSRSQTDEQDVPYDTFGTTGGVFGNVDRQTDDRTAVLRYTFDAPGSDFWNVTAELSFSDQTIDQQYVEGSSPIAPPGGFPVVNADHRYQTSKLLVKNTALFATGPVEHDLRFGVELLHKERLDADSAPGGTDRRVALFAADDLRFGALTVTPELRYEMQTIGGDAYGEYQNDAALGGLTARYAFAGGFSAFAGAYYNQNLPILDDLTNPAYMTRPEQAVSFEAGVGYDGLDLIRPGDAVAVKLNAYTTRIWDITSYSGITGAEMEGIELEAAYSMASGLYADINANLVRGRNTTPGAATDFWEGTPANQLRLSVGRRWGSELDLNWEMVADAAMDRSANPTAGFAVHNLRVAYRPQAGVLEGAELRLGVENLFDRDYTPHLATRPAPGRNIKITVAKTF